MTNKEIITNYNKMKRINTICKEKKIDRSNVVSGKSTPKNEKIVANEIIQELVTIVNEFFKSEDSKNENK